MGWFFRLGRWCKSLLYAVAVLLALVLTGGLLFASIHTGLEEGDWSLLVGTGVFVLSIIAMCLLVRLFRRLLERGAFQFVGQMMDWLDSLLAYLFVQPWVRRYELSAGIRIANLEQPLTSGALDGLDSQKLRHAVHQYEHLLETDGYMQVAGALLIPVVWFALTAAIVPLFSTSSLLVSLLALLPPLYILYVRRVKLIRDRLAGLRNIQRVLEVVDTWTLKDKLDTTRARHATASRELSQLQRRIRHQRIRLQTLQDALIHSSSSDEAAQRSAISAITTLMQDLEYHLMQDLEHRIRHMINQEQENRRKDRCDDRRWEIRKDIIVTIVSILVGLILSHFPPISHFLDELIGPVGIAP